MSGVLTTGLSSDTFKDIFHGGASLSYDEAIDRAKQVVLNFLRQKQQPFSGVRPADLHTPFSEIDMDIPLDNYEELMKEVQRLYTDHAVAFHLPHYIAHLNCPVVIPALAAEVLISAINSSLDTWDQSAGGTLMEQRLISWTAEQLGFGTDADGVFTSGGTQSNLTGLLLARDHYARKRLGHSVKRSGNPPQAARFRVFASEKAHFSNLKNASLLGLGEQAIVEVGTDHRFRMDPEALQNALQREIQAGNIPIAIVATAGTTDFGNVDPLDEIGSIARQYGLWFHVDAAYGSCLLLTSLHRHMLNGIELADSVTIDYHKSFFQPISSSAVVVRDKRTLQIIKHHADYLNPEDQDYEEFPAQVNKSVSQTTRRFDALKLWFTLRLLGKEKLGDYIDTIIHTTRQAARIIEHDPELELLTRSDISVLLFRYIPDQRTTSDLCKLNEYIRKKTFSDGKALVAGTRVDGKFYLKFTLLNPITTEEDIRSILDILKGHGNSYKEEKKIPVSAGTSIQDYPGPGQVYTN
ncbi:aspartate aminotransferase family protein [Sinomicrobium sp. FJxs]|uniref:Aspartate aminotransferase family protein n=2 Tax=Sinomicrobium weinanense TaxID=2842200 RepID=A0A926JNR8_9FLAO|nr:aspartate aminotransferase family protein [Sinomicrobium weinanense]MBU3124424.1 aspartate aminotransferase family protein [Sinomicrobium weinanense]